MRRSDKLHYRFLQYSAKADPLKVLVHVYDTMGVRVGSVRCDGTFTTLNSKRPYLARQVMAAYVNGDVAAHTLRQRREMLGAVRWLRLNP